MQLEAKQAQYAWIGQKNMVEELFGNFSIRQPQKASAFWQRHNTKFLFMNHLL